MRWSPRGRAVRISPKRSQLIRLGSDALASPGCHGARLSPPLPSQPVFYKSQSEERQSSVKVSQRQKNLKGNNILKDEIPQQADIKGGDTAAGDKGNYKGIQVQEGHLSLSSHAPEDYKPVANPAQGDMQQEGYFLNTSTRKLGTMMDVSPTEGFSAPKGPQILLGASTSLDLQGDLETLSETESALNEVEGIIEGRKLVGEEELMFLDAHPRVLFSSSPSPPSHPPVLLMLEAGLLSDDVEQDEAYGQWGVYPETSPLVSPFHPQMELDLQAEETSQAKARPRRSRKSSPRSREMPMCEVESGWVTDKTTAIDSYGKNVTVLPVIQTLTGPLQQYFYETRCKLDDSVDLARAGGAGGAGGAGRAGGRSGVSGGSCIGVDKRQWVSECKVKQSFVRALTIDVNKRVGWRWIRINSSCVCVLLSRVTRN
ncbi:uncharacterized protein LOC108923905 [Arapaima gigas]